MFKSIALTLLIGVLSTASVNASEDVVLNSCEVIYSVDLTDIGKTVTVNYEANEIDWFGIFTSKVIPTEKLVYGNNIILRDVIESGAREISVIDKDLEIKTNGITFVRGKCNH